MKNLLFEMYDEQKKTIDRLKKAIIEDERDDHDAVAKIMGIVMEKDIQGDQIERMWGR